MNVIETTKLTKYYGKSRGIVDVDMTVEEGEIYGFIGPNGAGKSTTIRTLLGLIYPTSGSATVFGKDITKFGPEIRQEVGYLPSEVFYYDDMRAIDLLKYSASFYSKDRKATEKRNQGARRAARPRPEEEDRRPVVRQQEEGRHHPGARARTQADHPRRADRRAGPAHPTAVLPPAEGGEQEGRHGPVLLAHPERGAEALRPGGDHQRGHDHQGRADQDAPRERHQALQAGDGRRARRVVVRDRRRERPGRDRTTR